MLSKKKKNPNPKMLQIHSLDEKGLRENILVPLLTKMGFKAVTIYHGPRERGKDIICFDYNHLKEREYFAIVAKTTELDGSVSSPNCLREVVYQVEQCLDVPYEDLFGMRKITMDRVWIVTTRKIVSGAADSIFANIIKRDMSKLIRFISGEHLIQLIDEHYPEYWDNSLESIDIVNEQKGRIEKFCRDLLLKLGGKPSNVDMVINQVINSPFPPKIKPYPDKSLSRLNSYSVEIDSVTPKYAHKFFSKRYGCVYDLFFKAKEDLYYAMFDVDEIMERYDKVINKTDPREFIEAFEKELSDDYPFVKAMATHAGEVWEQIKYLEDALDDVDDLTNGLQAIGKLKWATSLVDSVYDLEKEIELFLSHVEKERFMLFWRIETIQGMGKIRLLFENSEYADGNVFFTEHKKEIEISKFLRFKEKCTRTITAKDIIKEALLKIRTYLDDLLPESNDNNDTLEWLTQ